MISNNINVKIIGILLIGLGSSQLYPTMLNNTPKIFGKENSLIIIGLQMAVTYSRGAVATLLFGGTIADNTTFMILPFSILFGAVIIFLTSEYKLSY